jgi:hypothetical protein
MKNLITHLAVMTGLLLMSFVPKETKASQLNIRMFNDSRFTLAINGELVTRSATEARINHLRAGEHHIKVVKMIRSRYDGRRTRRVIFDGFVNIPRRKKIFAVVHPRRGLNFRRVINLPPRGGHNQGPPPSPACGNGIGNGNNYGQPTNYGNSNNFWFENLRAAILNASFESDKLRIAKRGINGRELSANEVSEIMNCFSFESTRLKFAKFAYNRTFDQENYFMVNNAFNFSSSIDELYNYIGSF